MKRFLSWIVLIGCFLVFRLAVFLDALLLGYIIGLYSQLGAFLKLVIIIFGGTFILGLAFTPLLYGISLSVAASEALYESQSGVRYIVVGTMIVMLGILDILCAGNLFIEISSMIYGVVILVMGVKTREQ